MSEPQPELRWAPIPPKPKRRGRVWLIVALVVLAVAIVGALLWFLLVPRDGEPVATPSATPTPTSTATTEPTPGTSPTPTETPDNTPPPVQDPDLATFVAQVQPRLDDASTGLDMLAGMSGPDAVQVIDQLQQDAERLADSVAPSSISEGWYSSVADYTRALTSVRTAVDSGASTTDSVAAARQALQTLRELVGI